MSTTNTPVILNGIGSDQNAVPVLLGEFPETSSQTGLLRCAVDVPVEELDTWVANVGLK